MAQITTRPAQGCTAGGQAPADDPYACDRCDLAETGTCGVAENTQAQALPDALSEVQSLTADRLAATYEVLTEAAEQDEPTSYTNERLYLATTRFIEVHMQLLLGADAIRGGPLAPAEPKIHRLR